MLFLIILATMVSTFLGGLFAVKMKDKLHLILGFSAGAVMGVAFFDLLPEAIQLAGKQFDIKITTMIMAVGFVVYLLLDRFLSLHLHEKEECANPCHSGQLGAFTLSFHSFLDGLGIGLAFKVSPEVGWIVTAAVLAHDFSDGINTVSMVLKSKGSTKAIASWLFVDALAPALGIAASFFINVSESVLGLILALFTGLFFYIGASDLIPESHHHHPTVWTTFATILGMLILYFVIRFAT